jgi:hypothetical protein
MFVATILIFRCALARRCPVAFPRHAIAAKIRGLRRPPEGPRTGFGDGPRRVASADSGIRPPGHRHVAPVDWVQSAVGMAPKDAVCAMRPDRKRSGGAAFAAPLPAVRPRPVRDLFRAVPRFGRVAAAHVLILSQLASEGAAGTVRAAFVARYLLKRRPPEARSGRQNGDAVESRFKPPRSSDPVFARGPVLAPLARHAPARRRRMKACSCARERGNVPDDCRTRYSHDGVSQRTRAGLW